MGQKGMIIIGSYLIDRLDIIGVWSLEYSVQRTTCPIGINVDATRPRHASYPYCLKSDGAGWQGAAKTNKTLACLTREAAFSSRLLLIWCWTRTSILRQGTLMLICKIHAGKHSPIECELCHVEMPDLNANFWL